MKGRRGRMRRGKREVWEEAVTHGGWRWLKKEREKEKRVGGGARD